MLVLISFTNPLIPLPPGNGRTLEPENKKSPSRAIFWYNESMNKKAIIVLSIIILTVGALYFLVNSITKKVSINRQIKDGTFEYCSMENGCPNDKCYISTGCADDSGEIGGCVAGDTECLYKDSVLKTNYIEITAREAKECVREYIKQNKDSYIKLQYVDLSSIEIDSPASTFPRSFLDSKDEKDKLAYFVFSSANNIPPQNKSYRVDFYVGAQTCKVYPNESLNKF